MSKKHLVAACAALIAVPTCFSLSGCSSSKSDKIVLRILNSEDYIYLNDPDEGYDEPDLTEQFTEWYLETYDRKIEVIYDTSDTNESIYNDLLTGRTTYDLINVSEYMAEKCANEGLTVPLDFSLVPNYNTHVSPLIRNRIDSIPLTNNGKLGDYVVGYMWGTLGLIINPYFFNNTNPDEAMEKLASDAQSYDILWNKEYKNTFTIKDSMRDTIAIALLHTYDSQFKTFRDEYHESNPELYNEKITGLFDKINRDSDEELVKTLNDLENNLDSLKTNSFGLEVDSGKQDITTGKIGINLAWSGDAVYALDLAEEDYEQYLYYAVPENGSNIWSDCWTMPKVDSRSDEVKQAAHAFLDFISMPENAAKNMDYTGYTPFIGGKEIFDQVIDWYDESEEEEEIEEEISSGINANDNVETEEEIDELIPIDLGYFFDGTYGEEPLPEDGFIVYTSEYLSFEDEENICVGRQFYTQYPDEDTINRCAVMSDYGKRNTQVLKLWERVKSDSLPVWAIVLLCIEVGAALAVGGYFLINHIRKNKFRQIRQIDSI